jgi:hypothetical protein
MGSRLNVEHGIVNQHLDCVKTEGSRKSMVLDSRLLSLLSTWRQRSEFRSADDWSFPSPVKLGPLLQTTFLIPKSVSRHRFRSLELRKRLLR